MGPLAVRMLVFHATVCSASSARNERSESRELAKSSGAKVKAKVKLN